MKFIKWFFITLVLLLGLLIVIGFFLPKSSHVERSITLNASMDEVFTQVNSFQKFNQWSPWFEKDPAATYIYSGPELGVGNKMEWRSKKPEVGNGSQEIIESIYPRYVKTRLYFGDDPEPGFAEFTIQELGPNQTKLTWGFDAEFGNNIIGRYFGVMMDGMLGPEYEKGLSTLKRMLE